MSGLLLGILATLLWSFVSIIDKGLVERFCKDQGVGALVILSSLFPVVLLPISYGMATGPLWLPVLDIGILLFSGFLTVAWLALYLNALYDEDVSLVIPFFQLTPVFALAFGFLFLGEWPETVKLLAGAVIVLGAFVLSVEQTTGRIKKKLLFAMGGASAIIALMNALFKFVTIEETFWVSMCWHSLGIFLTGFCLYLLHTGYRRRFHNFIRTNWGVGLSVNVINETLTIVGDVIFAFAILLAPLVLVQSMEAYQAVFVFIIGIILSRIAPRLLNEDFNRTVVIQKITGISLVLIGTIWLTFS